MHTFWSEIAHWLRLYVGSPGDPAAVISVVTAVVLAAGFVMVVAGTAVGMTSVGTPRKIAGLVLGGAVVLAALAATALWLPALVEDAALRRWLLPGIPALAALLISVPLVCWVARGRYIGSLLAFAMSLFAGFVAAQLVLALLGSIRGGHKSGFFMKERRDAMNRFLDTTH
jgi:hypothetical protein